MRICSVIPQMLYHYWAKWLIISQMLLLGYTNSILFSKATSGWYTTVPECIYHKPWWTYDYYIITVKPLYNTKNMGYTNHSVYLWSTLHQTLAITLIIVIWCLRYWKNNKKHFLAGIFIDFNLENYGTLEIEHLSSNYIRM